MAALLSPYVRLPKVELLGESARERWSEGAVVEVDSRIARSPQLSQSARPRSRRCMSSLRNGSCVDSMS